ncbi:MAG TPA: hypothetical protein VFY16_08280 [Gemmatimonadaceae bacterium]|nr:hypothetical protein [Gemmatimonadaceae bacterium]
MPYVDPIVLALLLIGLLASIGYQWRRGLRGRRLVVTVFAMFYGLTLMTMLSFHCIDVLYGVTHRLPSMTGAPIAYTWRTYSLLLFGALLVWLGARCVRAATRMGRGEAPARGDFLRLAVVVLAIVLPIIPIHAFFGYLISAASALTILVVAVVGRGTAGGAAPAALASSAS